MPQFTFSAHAMIGSDQFRLSQCYAAGNEPLGDGYVYAIKKKDSTFDFEADEELVNGGGAVVGKLRGALGYWKLSGNRVEYTDKTHASDFKVQISGDAMVIMTLDGKSLTPIEKRHSDKDHDTSTESWYIGFRESTTRWNFVEALSKA